jgi:competence protein ComEA
MREESSHSRLWGLVFLVLIAAIIAGGVVLVSQRIGGGHAIEIDLRSDPASTLEVQLTGAVAHEGIYDVDEETTLGDLLRVAGAIADDGERSRITIQVLQDNEDSSVESQAREETPDAGETGKVNLNTASLEELKMLPGIGDTKAQAIIDYRNDEGPFRSIDELTRVKGIGDKTLEELRDRITVVD